MRKLTLILTQIALYCACVAQTWSPVSVLPGSARTASPGFSIGNTGYIVGGESFSTTLTDCWSYNAANDLWALMAPYPGTPKVKPAAFSINGFGYYGLGTDSTFYKYDPVSNAWTQLASPSFGLNYWSSMYFTIGSDAYFLFASSSVFAKYNTISDTWTQLNNFPGTARFTGSGFAIGNKGYITCGANSFSVPYLNDLWEYDPTNDSWTAKSSLPATGRYATLALSANGKGYLLGGEIAGNTNVNEFWEYDQNTDSWSALVPFLGGSRNYLSGFSIGNNMYVGLGSLGFNNDFYVFGNSNPSPCVSLPTNLQNGLVGWWPFCGNANDESGNGLNGTVNGATLTSDRFGNFNSAYDFASGSQLIELPAPVPNTFTNSMSYSIWFKEIPSIDFLNIFNAAGKALVLNPNATGIRANDGNSFYLQGNSAALTVNDWKHVCVIYQGQDISIYINGVLVASGTTGFPATIQYLSQPSIVGSTYLMAGQYPFIGLIDDIGIWNRALTQQEIDTLFSGGSPQPPPPCVSLPTNLQNGLVGWWPFCGNANDESGNGNNGTASGAQLSIDRFGNSNNAYYFDGQDDYVGIPAVPSLLPNNISISAWVKIPSLYTANNPIGRIIRTRFFGYLLYFDSTSHNINFVTYNDPVNLPGICQSTGVQYNDDSWHHVVVTFDGSINNLFIDGLLVASVPPTGPDIYYQSDGLVVIGKDGNSTNPLLAHYQGWVDDIGIWNRALTPNEITQLNCGILPVVNPPAAITSTGTNAVFTASASVNNVSYQWQTNPANTGWVNVIDNATYSGSSANQLTVSNVQLSNHLQPFRVIASDTNCTDTSNVGSIFISDTCLVTVYDTAVVTVYDSITVIDTLLVTVYDTIYTSVTDTLIITVTGLQTPTGGIDVLVYPNPASASVQINFGPDYTAMVNYNLRIYNAGGSNVYGPVAGINQQLFTVPIAGWAPGIYFLELLDTGTSNTIVRKIVIQ